MLDGYSQPPRSGHATQQARHTQAIDEHAASGSSSPGVGRPADSASRAAPGPQRPPADDLENLGSRAFGRAMKTARSDIQEGRYREALYALSVFYNSPDLTPEEHSQLLDLLDPLAGEVVYSPRHLLEDPYEVRRNETLMDIAQRFQIPWELLRNINDVRNPEVLVPGTKLKVVPGPFRAEVDMQRGELTVFLGRLYAGRFPVTFGKDPAPRVGSYEVRDKRTDRAYFASDEQTIPANTPGNPYGDVWLDLGQELSIHGSPPGDVSRQRLGCISLSPRDAEDIFGILSVGSKVVIR
jgi:LysM repeat protein